MKETIYASVLQIQENGKERISVTEVINEKIPLGILTDQYEGIQMILTDLLPDDVVRCIIHGHNTLTSDRLGGIDVHGQEMYLPLGQPQLWETDGGFADVLCDYVFQFSRRPVNVSVDYQTVGIYGEGNYNIQQYRNMMKGLKSVRLTNSFLDTRNRIRINAVLQKRTERLIAETLIYGASFMSPKRVEKRTKVSFEENLTLLAAKKFASKQRTAVLNFANPIEPGGGVWRGASAQEEYLCRESNLYYSLSGKQAREYYENNQKARENDSRFSMFIGSDQLIYSPNVTVIKSDTDEWGSHNAWTNLEWPRYTDKWFSVDVITCAAPYFARPDFRLPDEELLRIYERRIRNILEAAIENEAETVILGAWGCGAFHNPPRVMASAFRKVLLEKRYVSAFSEVVFAVKRILLFPKRRKCSEVILRNFRIYADMHIFQSVFENSFLPFARLTLRNICV